jgi:hypothetical protein
VAAPIRVDPTSLYEGGGKPAGVIRSVVRSDVLNIDNLWQYELTDRALPRSSLAEESKRTSRRTPRLHRRSRLVLQPMGLPSCTLTPKLHPTNRTDKRSRRPFLSLRSDSLHLRDGPPLLRHETKLLCDGTPNEVFERLPLGLRRLPPGREHRFRYGDVDDNTSLRF